MEAPKNILIVEDDPLLGEVLLLGMQKEGWTVVGIARNLQEALKLMKQQSVDIALLDIQLDGPEDGVTTATELLKIKWMPIVYMTGNTPLEMKERLKETLPAAFLEKPLRMRELAIQLELALLHFNAGNLASCQKNQKELLFLPVGKGYIGIKVKEILYIKAERGYCQLFLSKEEYAKLYPTKIYDSILVLTNAGSVYGQLPSYFYRLSRSLVLNLNQITQIDSERLLICTQEIAIPEGRRMALMEHLVVVKKTRIA